MFLIAEINITDFTLSIIILSILIAFSYVLSKKLLSTICAGVLSISIILSWLFTLNILLYLSIVLFALLFIILIFTNLNALRPLFGGNSKLNLPFLKKLKNKTNIKKEKTKIYDAASLYKEISEAVIALSSTKTGAIITFQRKDELKGFMKNGIKFDAEVKKELLLTIFYEGTRLHDGAVIIKDDRIIAASVYYLPTTRPLVGKFGSRHRAALGVSEMSDSITVVVSEETGRISIAQHGQLDPVSQDNFLRVFSEVMDDDE